MAAMTGSAPSADLVLFVAFLVAMPLVVFVAGRLRLPYTVVLVLVGLAVSALPIQASSASRPSSRSRVLLPGLVFEAAYPARRGRAAPDVRGRRAARGPRGPHHGGSRRGRVCNIATGLPLEQAFVVGAIVSATDPVAVVSTMRRLAAPTPPRDPRRRREPVQRRHGRARSSSWRSRRSGRTRRPSARTSSSSRSGSSASVGDRRRGRLPRSRACSWRPMTISSS